MRIGINARYIQKQHTGIENYLSNTIINLISLDSRNQYVLYYGNDRPLPEGYSSNNFSADIPRMNTNSQLKRILWEHLYLPKAIKRDKIDIFHEPSFIAPMFKKCKTIITVYDLAFIYHPECFAKRNILYFKTMLKRSIEQSDAIIAISESTKNDIINCFKVKPEKIKVIYCGYNEYFNTLPDKSICNNTLSKYGINKRFFLNVSLISPRKNLINLIKAFKACKDSGHLDCQLVIAGAKGWLYDEIFKLVTNLSLEKDVVFTGYVSDQELLHLYNTAAAFVYPSVYEGFGLPVLEAMACKCPVICSNSSSLPEVAGNAAIMVDPGSIEELKEAMITIMADKTTANHLKEKGIVQLRHFSWKNSANETLNLYNSL